MEASLYMQAAFVRLSIAQDREEITCSVRNKELAHTYHWQLPKISHISKKN